jgi:hypothetical protein
MSRGYLLTNPAQVDAVGGDPATGTKWRVAFETARLALYNAELAKVDNDVTFLMTQIGTAGVDNLSFQYKSATAITVSAGLAVSDDGTVAYTLAAATDVSLDSDMDTGAKAATKTYYVWIGQSTVDASTKLKFSLSATAPTNLLHPHKLKWYVTTDGSSNLVAFWYCFGDNVNNVTYNYTDADTITIDAGTEFTVTDGTLCRIEAATALKLSTGRTADIGAEAADTKYSIWGGLKVSDGTLGFYFHTGATVKPSELAQARLLRGCVRNDHSSNLMPFYQTMVGVNNAWQFYDVETPCTGSDVTEVLDATVSTTYVDVDCSPFVPAGAREVLVNYITNAYTCYVRRNGSAVTVGVGLGLVPNVTTSFKWYTDSSGIFEVKNTSSQTTRASLVGFAL